LSNAKYEYAKIHRKILLEDVLAMLFIDFGLLCSPYPFLLLRGGKEWGAFPQAKIYYYTTRRRRRR